MLRWILGAHGLGQLGESGARPELLDERLEQSGSAAEDRVDGRAGDLCARSDQVETDRLVRRLAQLPSNDVEDALPGRLRGFRAKSLLVLARRHAPSMPHRSDI